MEEQQNGVSQPPSAAPEVPAAAGDSGDHDGIMLFLSYFGIFALIPYLTVKDDEFVKWHAKQGLTFLGATIALSIIFAVVTPIPVIGWIIGLGSILVWVGIVVIWVVALIKAFGGERWRIPIVADLAEKW